LIVDVLPEGLEVVDDACVGILARCDVLEPKLRPAGKRDHTDARNRISQRQLADGKCRMRVKDDRPIMSLIMRSR
jgi:hypothetical protein